MIALPVGQDGEIWVRCGSTLREYRGRVAETAAVLAGGWYHTGDAGRVDERGYDGATLTAQDILAHTRGTLAAYKVPKSIRLTAESLPVSPAGKILKRTLREQWQQ